MRVAIIWARSFFMALGMCVSLFLVASTLITSVLTYGMKESRTTFNYRMELTANGYLVCLFLTWVFVHVIPRTEKFRRYPITEILKAAGIMAPAVIGYVAMYASQPRLFQLGILVSLTLICYAEERRREIAVTPMKEKGDALQH